ncbi:MAG TPA: peptidyl-prolyl cis-trans isomerase [Sorangium sp.]|nr:peptidyl-prolyl cis-trans isomerase [Sorangium sp.]
MVAGLLLLSASGISGAVSSTPQDSRVVVKVGDSTFTVADMRRRMARIPSFQLRSMGTTPNDIKRSFAEALATSELLVKGAQAAGLDKRSDVRDRIRAVLRAALLSDLREQAATPQEISDDEVRRYYQANITRYQSPKRIRIWQILLASQQDAEAVLATIANDEAYQKDPMGVWEKLAREKSIDKSTSMRRGNLGFVEPDGATAHRAVRVDPALYQAALAVADGQVVPTPVKVKGGYAVVQRRGSHGPIQRPLAMEATTIRNTLAKERVRAKAHQLLARLRTQYVRDFHPEHIDKIEMTPRGPLTTKVRPGTLRRRSHPAAAPGRPQGHPGHLR